MRPTHLIFIKSGTVEISIPSRNTHIPIAVVGAGKVLGLRALVSGELPEIEATCLERLYSYIDFQKHL